jgi:hypothetical protein
MAKLNTPISAAETKAQAEDTKRNPSTKVGGSAGTNGQNVFVTLCFTGGQTIDPKEIFDMVDDKFGTVASVKSTVSRGTYIFNIES